jgi:hypothetical protein
MSERPQPGSVSSSRHINGGLMRIRPLPGRSSRLLVPATAAGPGLATPSAPTWQVEDHRPLASSRPAPGAMASSPRRNTLRRREGAERTMTSAAKEPGSARSGHTVKTGIRKALLAGLAVIVVSAGPVAAMPAPRNPEPDRDRPLGPTIVQVRGRQFPVDAEQGRYSMLGDLIGRWTIRSAPGSAGYSLPETPWTRVQTGQERFVGCLDRNYSQECETGEPSGALGFNYALWKQYDPDYGWLVKGKCLHSITGGSGDFTGARGALLMYRGPAGRGEEVNSIYKGEIALNAMLNERALQNDDASAGSAVRTASC